MKNKRHLFFDFDDTLWDFKKNSTVVLRDLFSEYGLAQKLNTSQESFIETYKRVNQEFWSRYYKKQISKQYLRNHRFNETFKLFGYNNYAENVAISEQYLGRAPKGNFLKDNCVEALEYLSRRYCLHIITNGFKESQNIKLDSCGLRAYFRNIIISEEYELVKPDEKIFRLAEVLSGAQADDCVMIGDSFESDIEGAVNAGWEAVFFTENNNPDYKGPIIKNLAELKTLF